jgi:hypothetical protein
MGSKLLKYYQDNHGQLICKIDINDLFASGKEKKVFFNKKDFFLNSDENNKMIYKINDDCIEYRSEELIPKMIDDRPVLLFVLGNPASHSINSEMFFSFEANNKEHRFWKKIIRESGIKLSLSDICSSSSQKMSLEEQNTIRKKKILQLDYDSPFRIGLSVFHSMPSGASGKWSGVAGIHKLLGIQALRRLEQEEKKRALETIETFITGKGAVVVFQKNAWENLKSDGDPDYEKKVVDREGLRGTVCNRNIDLICLPPTRLSGPCSAILASLTEKYKQ